MSGHADQATRDERLLRAIASADEASTSMVPFGPMNDKWLVAFKAALAAEGLDIREALAGDTE